MVDLHTHILPNIDDGADSVSEAQKMAQALYNNQIERVVCTPHFDPSKLSIQDFVNHREAAMNLMEDSKVALIAGSETVLHDYLFYYPDISQLAIGTTGYILLELPYVRKWDTRIFESIEKLMLTYNLQPVIAHIERYEAVRKKKQNIIKLIKIGCLLQLNAGSVINRKSRHRSLGYIRHGYIDILASDCHNMNKRPPNLTEAYDIILQKLGADFCDRLKENAENMADGIKLKEKTVYIIE